jgi:hypothetical protein
VNFLFLKGRGHEPCSFKVLILNSFYKNIIIKKQPDKK